MVLENVAVFGLHKPEPLGFEPLRALHPKPKAEPPVADWPEAGVYQTLKGFYMRKIIVAVMVFLSPFLAVPVAGAGEKSNSTLTVITDRDLVQFDDLSPGFKITGVGIEGDTIVVSGVTGYYDPAVIEVMGVTAVSIAGELRFVITFKAQWIGTSIRSQIVDFSDPRYLEAVKSQSYAFFPREKVERAKKVRVENLNCLNLNPALFAVSDERGLVRKMPTVVVTPEDGESPKK